MQAKKQITLLRGFAFGMILLFVCSFVVFGVGMPSTAYAQAGPTTVPETEPTDSPLDPQSSAEDLCVACEFSLYTAYVPAGRMLGEWDTQSNQIRRKGLKWPIMPRVGAVTPDGKRLFMVGWIGKDYAEQVYGLDTDTYTINTTIPLPGEDQRGLAISRDGKRMYVADNALKTVSFIDLETNHVIKRLFLDSHPEQIALSPNGALLYVSGNAQGALTVIDTASKTVIHSIPGGDMGGIYVSADGQRIFVVDRLEAKIKVLRASDFSLLKDMPAHRNSFYLLSNLDGTKLYCLNYTTRNLAVYNMENLTFIKNIDIHAAQKGAAFTQDGIKMYVASNGGLSVIDSSTDTVIIDRMVFGGVPQTVAAIAPQVTAPGLLIKNGGFNGYLPDTSKIPLSWEADGFAATDGKFTAASKEGAASVRIGGEAGKTKSLLQVLSLSGVAGDRYNFSYWAKGNAIPNAGACRGNVLVYNGAAVVSTETVDCSNGTYADFEKKTLTFTIPAAYTRIVIRFVYSKASGAVWFDMVSLVKQ